ncbi:DUF2155 domain-containing protein [Rhodopila sp.]|uniref:DUF2155 domain-containing protein n=1 Tax=Rhodopila sp. TaxID=2480087 RepID=UPI003D1027CA
MRTIGTAAAVAVVARMALRGLAVGAPIWAMLAGGAISPAWAQNGATSGGLPPLQKQKRPEGYPAAPIAPTWQGGQAGAEHGVPGGRDDSAQGVPGQGIPGQSTPEQSILGGQRVPGQSVLGGSGGDGGGSGGDGQNVLSGPGAGQVGPPQGEGSPGQTIPTPDAAAPDAGDQAQAPQAAPAARPAPIERPNVWVPATVAKLQALDKVDAQAKELTIKVGQTARFGSLTIAVKSCMIRPPNLPADAAAYLDVTDSHPDQPGFDGWMLQDEPSVSMMQHPIYDLRVTGCA